METLETIGNVFKYILPIVAVAVLVALLIVLIKVIKLVNTANSALKTLNGYVDEFNVTVKTVNNVAFSIEGVRVALESMVKKAVNSWNKQYEQIKEMVASILEKLDKKPDVTVEKTEEVIEQTEKSE